MKKSLLAIFIILTLALASCGNNYDPRESFEIPMRITARLLPSGSEFTASVYPDRCEISFSGSHSLSSTKLCLGEEKNTAAIEGFFEREVPKGCFPAQESLYKAVLLLEKCAYDGEKYENQAKYTIDETTIIVYYDIDTETVTHIETEENGRRFLFAVTSLAINEAQSNGAG